MHCPTKEAIPVNFIILFICIPFLICYHFQPLLPLSLSFCFSSQGCAQRTHSYTRLLSPRRGKARAMLPHRTTYWPGRIKLSLTGVRSFYIFKGCRGGGGGVLFMTALSTTNQLDFRSCCALNRSQQLHWGPRGPVCATKLSWCAKHSTIWSTL